MTTFATEKLKPSSYRMALVRLTPGKYLNDNLSADGGGVYSLGTSAGRPIIMSPMSTVARIERNGVALSSTASNPPTVNDTYYISETTNTLKVKLAAAPSASNVLVMFYYIYLATEPVSAGADPTGTSRDVIWEPRVINSPDVSQNVSDVVDGTFTLSSSGISIANPDRWFNRYLTQLDSFYKKKVEIWYAINDVGANCKLVFTGTISGVRVNSDTVDLSFTDGFQPLKQTAYMGDTYQESIFLRESGSYPSANPAQVGQPCRYIIGASSRYQQAASDDATYTYRDSVGTGDQLDSYYEDAVCTSFTMLINDLNNRVWTLCRTKTGLLKTQTFGSITRVASLGGGAYFYVKFSGHNLKVGETVRWTEAAVVYYGQVTYDTAFTYSGNSYDCAVLAAAGGSAMTTSSTFTAQKGVALYWYDSSADTWRTLYSQRDWTTSTTTTSGGNDLVKVTFANSFETALGVASLDPTIDKIKFRVFLANDSTWLHSTVLQSLVEASGLTIDTTTFTAAGAQLAANCMFSIPNLDETDYRDYFSYIQDMLVGTMGMIALNDSQQVEYHLLDAPSSTDSRDGNLALNDSVECEVGYQDIYTEVVASNPHNVASRVLDDTSGPAVSRSSLKAKYLHGGSNRLTLRHCLEKIGARIDAIINLRSMRRALYTFKTATADLSTEIGDDVLLETNVIGSNSSDIYAVTNDSLTVVGYQRGLDSTTVTATDLEGL